MSEIRTWRAAITVQLHDDGAALLEQITGMRPDTPRRRADPYAEITVEVVSDDTREAFALALEQAVELARLRPTSS